jgi:hypothetical protein
MAKALVAIARTYSGEEGRARLEAEGYPPEMLDAMAGAGTRTLKFRGGMGLLGVIGKYGMYRFANMMALASEAARQPIATRQRSAVAVIGPTSKRAAFRNVRIFPLDWSVKARSVSMRHALGAPDGPWTGRPSHSGLASTAQVAAGSSRSSRLTFKRENPTPL